jgi:6,7-dimethyl-8-ribityllumazine synthase
VARRAGEKAPKTSNHAEDEMVEIKTHEGNLNAAGKRFALVVSRYNEFFSSRLLSAAQDCLLRHGAAAEDVEVYRVPGSFEIPLAASKVAEGGRFHAIVCLGAVLRGQTPHFDFIAAEVAKGVARVNMETGVPTILGVITTDTIEQAVDRSGARAGNRGAEAAMAAIEMANLLEALSGG